MDKEVKRRAHFVLSCASLIDVSIAAGNLKGFKIVPVQRILIVVKSPYIVFSYYLSIRQFRNVNYVTESNKL